MLEFLSPGVSLTWDLVWQPCLFLGAGLGATFALGRKPARAHRILVLAVLASLSTPLFCQGIRRAGLGILNSQEVSSAASAETPISATFVSEPVGDGRTPRHLLKDDRLSHPADPQERAQSQQASLSLPTGSPVAPTLATQEQAILPVSWSQLMLGLWLLLSGLATARLAASFVAGVQLVRRAN
jgi:hypothetical protein